MTTYVFSPSTRWGPQALPVYQVDKKDLICKTEKPEGFYPIVLVDGYLICQAQSGRLVSLTLDSHDAINKTLNVNYVRRFHQLMNLNRFEGNGGALKII